MINMEEAERNLLHYFLMQSMEVYLKQNMKTWTKAWKISETEAMEFVKKTLHKFMSQKIEGKKLTPSNFLELLLSTDLETFFRTHGNQINQMSVVKGWSKAEFLKYAEPIVHQVIDEVFSSK